MKLEASFVGTRTLEIDISLALVGQGVPPGACAPAAVLSAARRAVEEGGRLFSARFVRAVYAVERRTAVSVHLDRGSVRGEGIAVALEGATHVVAIVCTLGPASDRRVSAVFDGDPLLALALDGLGSAACDRLAGDICAEIERYAAAEGNRVTGPLSPGMIGWPLREAQDQLFGLVDPAPIGVVLAPSGQMIPRKSLSFVVGVGATVRSHVQCASCDRAARCTYRSKHA